MEEGITLLLLILMNMANQGNCSNQVSVLKYKKGNECSNALVGVPIKSISSTLSVLLEEFTFCGKYYFRFLHNSFLMGVEPDLILSIWNFERIHGYLLYQGTYYTFYFNNQTVTPDSCQYVCLAISSIQTKIVWNGEILFSNPIVDVSKEKIKATRIWLGGASFSIQETNRRFEGIIANPNFWNYALQDDDLISITTNNNETVISKYDLLSNITPKNSSCLDYLILDENDVLFQAHNQHAHNNLIEYKTDFDSSNYLCDGYGGNLTLPKNEEDLISLGYLIQQSEICEFPFLGLKKSSEGKILDLKDNHVPYLKWHLNQPNGGETQKCINTWDSYVNDEDCDRKFCFFCQIPEKSMFVLRGPIPKETERKYFVTMNRKNIEIRGITKMDCFWNKGIWNFGDNLKLDNATNNMPPVGLRTWNKGNRLKFTQCKKNEFTCYTYGHCIPLNKRCDGHPDCPIDGSDENECKLMTLGKGYDRKHPPTKNTTSLVFITVYDITDIEELDMSYTVYFKVTMKWFDSRIIFRNLKATDHENQLENSQINEIWVPNLYMVNSYDNIYMKAQQENEKIYVAVRIYRNGSAKQNELSEIDEDYLYPGKDNHITLENYLHIKLGCKFDLKW